MKTQYFDNISARKAIAYITIDPILSKEMFESYFEKYPKDYTTYSYYITLLVNMKLYKEAEKALKHIHYLSSKDTTYEDNKREILEEKLLFATISLYIRKKKYQKCIDLINCIPEKNIINTYGYNGAYFYCQNKLGQIPDDQEPFPYLFEQIYNYSEDKFLEHIKSHLAASNDESDINHHALFYEDFPILDVYKEVKKQLPNNKATNHGFFEDLYIFKYYNCGRCNNKIVDYFNVVTFTETNNLITIYPSDKYKSLPITDLNYMNTTNKPKTKRLSQIDKFNQRYKK